MIKNMETSRQEEEQKNGREEWDEVKDWELKMLRKRQLSAKRKEDFSPDDRERLVFLQDLKDRAAGIGLSPEEKDEMRELQKDQMASKDWTPEKAARLRDLHERMEK